MYPLSALPRPGEPWRWKLECHTHLEVKDDRPYEPKGELGVAIDDILTPDVDKFDLQQIERPLQNILK